MTDKPDNSEPGQPAPEDGGYPEFEQELDDALGRASSLADDLASEVGQDEAPSADPSRGASPGSNAADFDAALSELESLIVETERQVDDSADEPPAARKAEPAAPKPPSLESDTDTDSDYEVPEFMNEFMAPESPKPDKEKPVRPAPPSAIHSSPSPAVPNPLAPTTRSTVSKSGVVGTGMLGIVGGEVVEPATAPKERPAPGKPERAPKLVVQHNAKPWSQRLIRPIEGPALKAADLVASAVELLDRPISALGRRWRMVLGWIALATFGTAVVAYLATLI